MYDVAIHELILNSLDLAHINKIYLSLHDNNNISEEIYTHIYDLVDSTEDLDVELLIWALKEKDEGDFDARIFNEITESRIDDNR